QQHSQSNMHHNQSKPMCDNNFNLNLTFLHHNLHSFPTRRSSDLDLLWNCPAGQGYCDSDPQMDYAASQDCARYATEGCPETNHLDRKSTRLNSSHVAISYAVFCLKKKKISYYTSLYKKMWCDHLI